MWKNIRRVAKETPGAITFAAVGSVTFVSLCLYLWIGPDTVWKPIAVLVWLLFMVILVRICGAIDLFRI